MIASLRMYDRPQNRAAHDDLWVRVRDGLHARGIDAPDALDHEVAHDAPWSRPDLVLGHICNLPYRAKYRDRVTLIGAPDYGLPDTQAGYYHSVYVVHADDPAQSIADTAGHRYALNEPLSHSGWGAAFAHAQAEGRKLNPAIITGAHRASVNAIVAGAADLASIDAQSWWMDRDTDAARALRMIGRTPASPGMSFITAGNVDPTPYFDTLQDAIARLPVAAASMLGLRGIVQLPTSAYDLPLPDAPQLSLVAAQ